MSQISFGRIHGAFNRLSVIGFTVSMFALNAPGGHILAHETIKNAYTATLWHAFNNKQEQNIRFSEFKNNLPVFLMVLYNDDSGRMQKTTSLLSRQSPFCLPGFNNENPQPNDKRIPLSSACHTGNTNNRSFSLDKVFKVSYII